jgi:hypothetical protein
MKTSKLCKLFSLVSAATISSFGMWLINQGTAFAVDITPSGWCIHSGSYIVFGYFDGDGKRDALCADFGAGKWINYGDGDQWSTQSSWCTHSGSRIYAYDVTQDDQDDLVCKDSKGGYWELPASNSGGFDL